VCFNRPFYERDATDVDASEFHKTEAGDEEGAVVDGSAGNDYSGHKVEDAETSRCEFHNGNDLSLPPYMSVESICGVATSLAFSRANCLDAASRGDGSPLGTAVSGMDELPSNRHPPYGSKSAQVHGDCGRRHGVHGHVHCIVQTLRGQGRELKHDENDTSSFR
jgi:hypothetical protein